MPALHRAAKSGDLDTIIRLIGGGIPVNATDHHGMTALHHAARAGQIRVVEALVNRGANVNAVSKFDGDPHDCSEQLKCLGLQQP